MRAWLTFSLALLLCACGNSSTPGSSSGGGDLPPAERSPSILETRFPGIRTVPNLLCAEDYLGTTGLLIPTVLNPEQFSPLDGGPEAPTEIAATLPRDVQLRGSQESFTGTHYYAVREGRIWLKANRDTTGVDEPWRQLRIPRCLDGQVSEISADGTVLLALNQQRQIYSLDHVNGAIGSGGWTRRCRWRH